MVTTDHISQQEIFKKKAQLVNIMKHQILPKDYNLMDLVEVIMRS